MSHDQNNMDSGNSKPAVIEAADSIITIGMLNRPRASIFAKVLEVQYRPIDLHTDNLDSMLLQRRDSRIGPKPAEIG